MAAETAAILNGVLSFEGKYRYLKTIKGFKMAAVSAAITPHGGVH